MFSRKLTTVVFLIILVAAAWLWLGSAETHRLAYCPTMRPYALALEQLGGFELVELGSSGEVLDYLEEGLIDAGLIGRRARIGEISPEIQENILKEGYTLIHSVGGLVHADDLPWLTIHTYLEEEKVSEMLPGHEAIVYHGSYQEAMEYGFDEAVLIDWQDYRDEPLIVPMINSFEKESRFRNPFLYYGQADLEPKVQGMSF